MSDSLQCTPSNGTPRSMVLRHSAIAIMSMVVAWLFLGAIDEGGSGVWVLVTFAAAMLGAYVLLCRIAKQGPLEKIVISIANALVFPTKWRYSVLLVFAALPIATSIIHYIWFDGFSIPKVLVAKDVLQAALIRQELSDMPNWLAYLRAYAINCLFPIVLLLAVVMKRWRLVGVVAFFGMLYAVNMLQKSGPILIVLPSILYLVHKSRYLLAAIWCVSVVIVVLFMSFLSNPHLQPNFMREMFVDISVPAPNELALDHAESALPDPDLSNDLDPPFAKEETRRDPGIFGAVPVIYGLFDRVAYVPGRVVSQWTTLIPKDIPYGIGCGYRFLAPLLDCDFQNYALIIHDKLYPHYVAQGLQGSVNAASMMVGYANFGIIGVLAYALMQAILAWMLFVLFRQSPYLILPINVIYLFLLSSSDLLTMLLSGGWSLSILLFLMLARQKDTTVEIAVISDNNATEDNLPATPLSGIS